MEIWRRIRKHVEKRQVKEKKEKIFGTLIFIILILVFLLLIFLPRDERIKKIETIMISGNKFLSGKDYLAQTRLNDKSLYDEFSLAVIKDRFEEHPYVLNADVELAGNNTAMVILTEKEMTAVVLGNARQYFTSEGNEILPFVPNTKFVDLPVITNPKDDLESFSFVKDDDITDALRIIYSAKLTDIKLYNRLSEVNLRNGGDIILMFSKISVPVIFGKHNAARKMVYLDTFWRNWKGIQNDLQNISYIDLRFNNNIYIGAN